MVASDLSEMLRKKPFVPFQIQAADGLIYDVRHPEMVLVTLTTVAVALPSAQPLPERMHILPIDHIIRLIPQTSATTTA
jgi:hypothetical protein